MSKYPIVAQQFKAFNNGYYVDVISKKGILYAKIQINNTYLHLFTVHTQASYKLKDKQLKNCVSARLDQFLTSAKFIQKCIKQYNFIVGEKIILAGDLNINYKNPYYPSYFVKDHSYFSNLTFIDDKNIYDEYSSFLNIFSMNKQFTIKNYLEEQCKQQKIEIPATLGVSQKDELGNNIPQEIYLTDKDDLNTNQLLDYIIELIPHENNHSIEKNESNQKLEIENIKLEKFEVKENKFTQLSDHYGLSANFNLKQ